VHSSSIQRAIKQAVRAAGVVKRVTSHALDEATEETPETASGFDYCSMSAT